MIFTLKEAVDALVMILVVGYIFKDFFKIKKVNSEGVPVRMKFSMSPIAMAIAVTAPAIILHELSHKFTALSFGMEATFGVPYLFLGIGVILKLIRSPIIFFIPAYVTISAAAAPINNAAISIVGPATNLILFLAALLILKYHTKLTPTQKVILLLTRKINGFLFIINMIPIPGFDGFHFFKGIFQTFF